MLNCRFVELQFSEFSDQRPLSKLSLVIIVISKLVFGCMHFVFLKRVTRTENCV